MSEETFKFPNVFEKETDLTQRNNDASNNIPPAAIIIDINVVFEIFSLKKIYAKIAATNGWVASIIIVTAAVVVVIESIKDILAIPRLTPPISPDKPIL